MADHEENEKMTRPLDPDVVSETEVPDRGSAAFPESGVFALVMPTGERVQEEVQTRRTLGRSDKRHRQVVPDIDLAAFGAWENGVSRVHAALQREGEHLYLIDLGSTNGTFLNDVRLAPQSPRLICDGDQVRLGLMRMRVFFESQDDID
ncbi:MAG: FHA domain-containing protein [Chloroflexi bacterium]|nr:FHA domain-containing protein [Chloroflexota bacterium]